MHVDPRREVSSVALGFYSYEELANSKKYLEGVDLANKEVWQYASH